METVEAPVYKITNFRFLFTLAIGLGFGTTALTWTFYNSNMIAFLETNFQKRYGLSATFLGFVMTWDNIIAIFLQPWIGAKSDSTRTRFGKRMPYILVGVPLAAIFFAIIPYTASSSIFVLVAVILSFNISMAIYRSPVVALMPDLTPPEHRSKGNGLINLMGGLFSGIALFVGGALYKSNKVKEAFGLMSIIMVITLIIFLLIVRENKELERVRGVDVVAEKKEEIHILDEFFKLFREEDKSKLFILGAIAAWFIAWNALEVWVAPFVAQVILRVTDTQSVAYTEAIGKANHAIFIVPILFVLATIPGGYLGAKFGQKRIIYSGLILFIASMFFANFATSITMVVIAMSFAGIAWGLINVNSIVIVWNLSGKHIGVGTGLYYLASAAAAITGPILFGSIRDISGTLKYVWDFAIVFLLLATLSLYFVRSSNVSDTIPAELQELD